MATNELLLTAALERIKRDLDLKTREVQSLIDVVNKPDRVLDLGPITHSVFVTLLDTRPFLDEAMVLKYHSETIDQRKDTV